MTPISACLLLSILIIQLFSKSVFGQNVTKGSLVFVIDDTGSMSNDIEQVKNGANQIFQTVLESKDSQIQNYVVVTFNDPDAKFWTKTENKITLQTVLNSLTVGGGDDCPEYAIKGIELALEESLPFSYIYVFTDATAKDYREYERIKRLSQQKQSQIVFALTGDCNGARHTSEYQMYHQIAEDTSGQVFHIDKGEVKKLLNYVKETITGRRNVIASLKLPPGHVQEFNISIDGHTGSTTIAVSGKNPTVDVIGPNDITPNMEPLLITDETKIVKLPDPKPGVYKIKAGGNSKTSVVVTGKTNIYFQHGFSPYKPTSISDTAARPAADGNTFLSIKLNGAGVILITVRILNMNDSVLAELPLEVINENELFYGTNEFDPPYTMFKIEVVGHDVNDTIPVIRRAQTSIERVPRAEDEVTPKIAKPAVVIMEASKGKDVELNCRIVQGKPKPSIRWEFHDKTTNTFSELREYTEEKIVLKSVTTSSTGYYKCIAKNTVGSDRLIVELSVEYPPKIEQDNKKLIREKESVMVRLMCIVDGVPLPSVEWYKNGTRIKKTRISKDYSISFNATLDDIGNYTCVANNSLGTDRKTVIVDVYVPITIDIPDRTTIDLMIGDNEILPCTAHGYPAPKIEWIFVSSDTKETPVNVRLINGTSVVLPRVQIKEEGAYICIASNVDGAANLTYTVNVFAEPEIRNMYVSTTFYAVVGDLALRIQCNTTGRPKPTISWLKDDSNIDFGNDLYDKAEDGTLIIKNIKDESQGVYVCYAENSIGVDGVSYVVEVSEYPQLNENNALTILIEDGSSRDIECPIHHENTDLLRWYKDDFEIRRGELSFNPITRRNAGFYTCRVSNAFKSQSAVVNIIVGKEPEFISEVQEDIHDLETPLVCEAEGDPRPTVTWRYNGAVMTPPITAFTLETVDETGKYECDLTNDFGSINRSFNVIQEDCLLNTEQDFFTKNQPFMISEERKWPLYDVSHGYMVIPRSNQIHLYCSEGFSDIKTKSVEARCKGGDKFNVSGRISRYSDINCAKETLPTREMLRTDCLGSNYLFQIGFKINQFYSVYEVCMRKSDRATLYTSYTLQPGVTNVSRDVSKWTNRTRLSFDKLSDCKDRTSRKHISYRWCFERTQLVNYRDLHPNVPVTVAYHPWNLIPRWSPCSSNNWDEVERRIRLLAYASNRAMTVHTGATGQLKLPDNSTVCLQNKRPLKQYLWKVIEDPLISASLAIIQVNVPGLLSAREAAPYVLCEDICNHTVWMKSNDWHDVTKGYIYCCNIDSFDKMLKEIYNAEFGFKQNIRKVLYNVNTGR